MDTHTNRNDWDEEEAMIARAKTDLLFFEPIYNKYYEVIFRYIHRKTDDEDLAADLTSKVFMNAMHSLDKFEFRGVPFGAWLYRIATNETNRHFRDNKRRLLSLEDQKVSLVMTCSELDEVDMEQKQRVLAELISELEDEEIRILELKFFETKNFKEIAFILDKKESAVKMKMYRSLDKLKRRYEKMNKGNND
ncbi:RNA polymerase sigma-70 factor, ECF subfamily [Reichenbachiella faecimaris]|uniref:RNA polymerase sigma-70 factor, ECF subfamily n=1 Tax=Reichenbachiella faecimaris TaxID=692418 RepID=A0A1W2GBR2_REIFA|nr:sigma-70 family RNA polymerase sigma factor [Reichenbachiella faecimaris]SMD34041.1 RNA polymerase sigma-70 factor, ECF subfamily [Reichenbachiella faecimaris]